jgi:hypothetical protein
VPGKVARINRIGIRIVGLREEIIALSLVMARLVVQTGHIPDTCSETSLTLLGCVV